MVSLYKALMMIGFEKVAPRTLRRGNVEVHLRFGYGEAKWEIHTPLGSATYLSQKRALHGLVLRFAISKEDLEILSSLGVDYAREELINFEKTMKRIEKGSRKAILNYISSIEREQLDFKLNKKRGK
ncbi:hypothetical protein V6M85_08865 [Sulfolobus tengchongensis]|uniref:Uncharacterized protein n=1 Tax=Sulfolobus tengchongensis TaxID=207809 RepID=A0AAX4KXV9_9CREN